jgi:hypothetical protein
MWGFLRVAGLGCVGAVSALALMFGSLCLYNATVSRSSSNEMGAWGWGDFVLLMGSPWVGLVLGLVVGVSRELRRRK